MKNSNVLEQAETFLGQFENALKLPDHKRREIVDEVRGDLLAQVQGYQKEGRSEGEAVDLTLNAMGDPVELARQIKDVVPPLSTGLMRVIRYLVAGGLALGVVFVAGSTRMGTISTEEASAFGRVEAWTVAINLLQSRPLFGAGAGEFMQYHFRTAHNSLLLCAAELGMFGLYAWVMMFYVSLKNLFFIAKFCRYMPQIKLKENSWIIHPDKEI